MAADKIMSRFFGKFKQSNHALLVSLENILQLAEELSVDIGKYDSSEVFGGGFGAISNGKAKDTFDRLKVNIDRLVSTLRKALEGVRENDKEVSSHFEDLKVGEIGSMVRLNALLKTNASKVRENLASINSYMGDIFDMGDEWYTLLDEAIKVPGDMKDKEDKFKKLVSELDAKIRKDDKCEYEDKKGVDHLLLPLSDGSFKSVKDLRDLFKKPQEVGKVDYPIHYLTTLLEGSSSKVVYAQFKDHNMEKDILKDPKKKSRGTVSSGEDVDKAALKSLLRDLRGAIDVGNYADANTRKVNFLTLFFGLSGSSGASEIDEDFFKELVAGCRSKDSFDDVDHTTKDKVINGILPKVKILMSSDITAGNSGEWKTLLDDVKGALLL